MSRLVYRTSYSILALSSVNLQNSVSLVQIGKHMLCNYHQTLYSPKNINKSSAFSSGFESPDRIYLHTKLTNLIIDFQQLNLLRTCITSLKINISSKNFMISQPKFLSKGFCLFIDKSNAAPFPAKWQKRQAFTKPANTRKCIRNVFYKLSIFCITWNPQ